MYIYMHMSVTAAKLRHKYNSNLKSTAIYTAGTHVQSRLVNSHMQLLVTTI